MSIELTPAVLARHAVLYVDDDEISRTVFARSIQSFVSVDVAESAAHAIAMLHERPYSLVVTDQRMPGMSGIELCVYVRAHFPRVRRMLVTAYGDLETATDAINRGGVSHFIAKPWKNNVLVHAIKETLERVELDSMVESLQEDIKKREIELALGEQFGRIVHDLSSIPLPIRTALLDLDVAIEDPFMSEQARALLRQQCSTLRLVIDHVETILRRSQDLELSPPRRRRYRVLTALKTARAMAAHRDRAPIDISCADPRLEFMADLTDVTRVLGNLVRNAQDAVAEARDDGRILMKAYSTGTEVAIEVVDNGPGIPAHRRGDIFQRGYSEKKHRGGNGLGLTICRDLTIMNGGALELHDNPSGGCRFIVNLPAPIIDRAPKAGVIDA